MIGLIRKLFALVFRAYTWLALAVVLSLGYFGVLRFAPEGKSEVGRRAEAVIVETLDRIVAELPEPSTPQTMLVLPFEGDRADNFFRERLAGAIRESGKYETVDKTFGEMALEMANLKWGDPASPERAEALAAARRAHADAVLVGRLTTFRQGDRPAIDTKWEAIDVAKEAALASGSEAVDAAAVPAARGLLARGKDAGWALLVWVGLALSLPLFLAGVLSNFLAKESNLTNLGLLAALTVANIGVALWLLGLRVDGLLDSLLLLAAGVAGGAYNYLLLDKLEQLRQA